jgi:hypothetical protein
MARVRIRAGSSRSIWWADDASGHHRAKDYFDKKLTPPERAKFQALFNRLADHGRIQNQEQFTKETEHIWCFKRGKHRITCFLEGTDWLLLTGFKKKDNWDKRHKREIEAAERTRTSHLERTRGKSK